MNVLFVSEYFPPKIMGGGEINLTLLAKALVKRGVDVSVVTSYHKGLQRYETVDGIRVYRTLTTGDSPSGIRSNVTRSTTFPRSVVKEVQRIVTKKNFDCIHFIGTSCIAAPKLKHLNIPLFVTVESYPTLCPKGDRIYHGKKECTVRCSPAKFVSCQNDSAEFGKMKNKWYFKYNPFFLWYVYRYYTRLNKSLRYCNIISISKYIQGVLQQHRIQSTVIPNALAIEDFTVKKDNIIKKENNDKNVEVAYLGALIKSKGPHVLIKSLQGLNCHCTLYGDGVLKKDIQRMITTKNINATIHEPVSYTEIPQVYAQSDIIVFPSVWPEPFGRISIESMAAGKPVIGSAIGGIKETIEQGAGILVIPGDVRELHAVLQTLIDKPELRDMMGRVGKKKVMKYSEDIVIQKLISMYKIQIINKQ